MSANLLFPTDAVDALARRIERSWAQAIAATLTGTGTTIEIRVRPSINSGSDVRRIGFDRWTEWRSAWASEKRLEGFGIDVLRRDVVVEGLRDPYVIALKVRGVEAASKLLSRFGHHDLAMRIARAASIGNRMLDQGAEIDARTIRAVCALQDHDVSVALDAVVWLRHHADLTSWTSRQLPIPGMHTKWAAAHEGLMRRLTGRDVLSETAPRVSVAHLTYVDPSYRASGLRHHDAWTSGDSHSLAYRPRVVLIVENRDCRLRFPTLDHAIVVEGQGRAVAALASIDWVLGADRVIYWGDMDADGFSILDHLRQATKPMGVSIDSMLMDSASWNRFRHLGVNRGSDGQELGPATAHLDELRPGERECYSLLATQGEVEIRRIEQERIPMSEAFAAAAALIRM